MVTYKQGDIIIMDFNPQKGHEQSGSRPTIKKHPFHIELDERTQTTGVILCDQAKMLDIGARNAQFKEECPEDIWNEAKELVISFM